MSIAARRITFGRWLAVCLLVVWPLNIYYFAEQRRPQGADSFMIHGALVGAIIACVLGIVNVRRARQSRAPARPGFWRIVGRYGWWCVALLPLLFRLHWSKALNRTDQPFAGAALHYSTTTTWGWGGPVSAWFALAVAFALFAVVWRQQCEAPTRTGG